MATLGASVEAPAQRLSCLFNIHPSRHTFHLHHHSTYILLDTVIKYHQAGQILGGVPSIMHVTTFVLPLLVTSLASAKSLSLFGSGQQPLDAKLDVPGDNPLQFCQATSDYILLIQNVDLAPNPPKS